VLIGVQHVASMLLTSIEGHTVLDAGVATGVIRLQNDPAVVEMQLQLLTAWTAQLHKEHTAQQQQQQQPSGTAGASSSSTQQQQQQTTKQQHRADLLSIPAFHQDMLQLLPGGQAYLDAAAEEAAGWELDAAAKTARLHAQASGCCYTLSDYLNRHLQSIAGQQVMSRNALVVSGAAVRLVLELQLLASGAVQRRQEQQRQQQQQASPRHR
jgi:DNA primase